MSSITPSTITVARTRICACSTPGRKSLNDFSNLRIAEAGAATMKPVNTVFGMVNRA